MCEMQVGDYARDKISGLEGRILGICYYLYDVTAVWLHPINERESSGRWLPMVRCEKKEETPPMGLH